MEISNRRILILAEASEVIFHNLRTAKGHVSLTVSFPPPDWEKHCAIMVNSGQDGMVFLESFLETWLCGNTRPLKYQLMTCESCILIMLMCFFFLLCFLFPSSRSCKIQLCKLTLCVPWKLLCSCFLLLIVTHNAASSQHTAVVLQICSKSTNALLHCVCSASICFWITNAKVTLLGQVEQWQYLYTLSSLYTMHKHT